jgi:CDP-diacylglycerol---glycerol-3-phosphate 3-phosphatidyltransferase
MNLPNLLTLFRIFLVPVIVVILLTRLDAILAFVIFVLAALTDLFDGYFARKYQLVTAMGKLLDPIADKLLVSAAFISLVELGKVPSWVVVIIIGREFAVSGLRMIAVEEGTVIAAAKLGKIKAVLQIIAISVLILDQPPYANMYFHVLGNIALVAAVVFTIWSGTDYFVKYFQALQGKADFGDDHDHS